MNKLDTILPELLNILKVAKIHIKREKGPLLLVDKKRAGKMGSKKSQKLNPKGDIFKKKKAKNIPMGITYYYCSKMGHWKKIVRVFLQA